MFCKIIWNFHVIVKNIIDPDDDVSRDMFKHECVKKRPIIHLYGMLWLSTVGYIFASS